MTSDFCNHTMFVAIFLLAAPPPCEDRCATAGHCCVGTLSACQRPSCAMGCIAGANTVSEAACNATCDAAGPSGCEYTLPGTDITFQQCGVCPYLPAPAWWPASVTPAAGGFI